MTKIVRSYIEGALYYVTPRGDNNEEIFKDPKDYNFYLELLSKYKEQYGFKLFSFILMPNHLHLLIELKEGIIISDIMHDINSNYTKYFNGRYERKGHLFQERYKMILLEKAQYLLPMSAYIHLNPSVSGFADGLSGYPFSSYLYYTGIRQEISIVDMHKELMEIEKLLESTERKPYEDFLKSVSKGQMQNLCKELDKKTTLGSPAFVQKVILKIESERQKNLHAASNSPSHKIFVTAGAIVILILGGFTIYFYTRTAGLKESFQNELNQKSVGYQAQMDYYYREISKALQIERQKTNSLEERLIEEAMGK